MKAKNGNAGPSPRGRGTPPAGMRAKKEPPAQGRGQAHPHDPATSEVWLPGISRPRQDTPELRAAIARLVTEEEIGKLAALQARLAEMGFHPSLATLSRIRRSMNLHKDERGFYTLDPARERESRRREFARFLAQYGVGAVLPTSLLAIKTRTGFARPAGVLAQEAFAEHIAGFIAGDDTVLLLLSSDEDRDHLAAFLQEAVPKLMADA